MCSRTPSNVDSHDKDNRSRKLTTFSSNKATNDVLQPNVWSSLMRIELESLLMRLNDPNLDRVKRYYSKWAKTWSSWTSITSANTFHNERCCSSFVIQLGLKTLHLQTSLGHCHIVNIWTLVFGKFILDRIGV